MLSTLTLVLNICVIFGKTENIFDVKADDVFESIIGKVYTASGQKPEDVIKILDADNKNKTIFTTKKVKHLYVVNPERKYFAPLTKADLIERKRKRDLEILLKETITPIPDFKNNVDDIRVQTRRFDSIRKSVDVNSSKHILREEYFSGDIPDYIYYEKVRAISLMEQFIYATRYKLPIMQKMRRKYKETKKYQIGYCIALLRQLKYHQKMIYATLSHYHEAANTLHVVLKLYEKVVRLDVDIKDLLSYVKRLEYERKTSEDPDYYDEVDY